MKLSNTQMGILVIGVLVVLVFGAVAAGDMSRMEWPWQNETVAPEVVVAGEMLVVENVERDSFFDIRAYEWRTVENPENGKTATILMWYINIDVVAPDDGPTFDSQFAFAAFSLLEYGFATDADVTVICFTTTPPGEPIIIVGAILVREADWAAWREAYPEPTVAEGQDFLNPQFTEYPTPYLYECDPATACVTLEVTEVITNGE